MSNKLDIIIGNEKTKEIYDEIDLFNEEDYADMAKDMMELGMITHSYKSENGKMVRERLIIHGDEYLMTHPRFNKIILVHMGVAADKFDTEDQAREFINKYKEQCLYESTIVDEIEVE